MDASDPTSCSGHFLHVIEEHGLAGRWHWSFGSGRQVWSPGLFRILGLDASLVAAGYDLLRGLVHPDDRAGLASPGEVLQGHVSPAALVRVIRPGGELRVVSLRSELRVSPEGRPLALSGVALDVTDRERLRRMQAAERRQRQSLYRSSYTTTFSLGIDGIHDFPAEVAQVHGQSLGEINVDPFVMIVRDERGAFRDRAWDLCHRHLHFQGTATERLANGETWCFRIIGVPVWDEAGGYLGRAGVKYPIKASGAAVGGAVSPGDDRLRRSLEQALRAHHFRAARGLLDWSRERFADASGLSLSTVRRLEADAEVAGAVSRHWAVTALRRAGIRFVALDDGTIAVAKA